MLVVESLPKEQKELIIEALSLLEAKYQAFADRNTSDMDAAHKVFDAFTLKALMKYDVNVVLTQEQFDRFTADNKVDFPQFISK